MIDVAVTPNLSAWPEIEDQADWNTLLLGNGASVNIWSGFSYTSLYEIAVSEFDKSARAAFEQLETSNFEEVLAGLSLARGLASAVGAPFDWVDPVYDQVRDGLFHAVGATHVPWDVVPTPTREALGQHMVRYKTVFTLNYDLLLYWSLQLDSIRPRVADLFWNAGSTFDALNANVGINKTEILHLHGGLHLWRDAVTGASGKWTTANLHQRLLDDLRGRYRAERRKQPLFVSEGRSIDKLRAIQRSDYLSFAHRRLQEDQAHTVVFGAGLGASDRHVAEALATGQQRSIAVSVYPHQDPADIMAIKLQLRKDLRPLQVLFFDSTTHPLGDPALQIEA
ncbi:DUF4917 family protein [Umezawaea endophytica]|uniref:DUF4917 family protein n=1 Tax=Umezawaea endophytica TaxID=1654476 RepID=A0A9X3ALK6_9PSEU|nr:DUF4917 family protein [Umezawaea endophytica]MCS7484575.1 DUF4917 family protein [Umezawaea endophytica]